MMKPQNFPERVIWYSMLGTYPLYFLGLLFPVMTITPWILLIYLAKQIWRQFKHSVETEKICIPWVIWVWIVSMIVMAGVISIGLIDYGYDDRELIRSLLNWTRDWALFAILPAIGCCLKIRPQLIYRAACIICLESSILIPVCWLGYILRLPAILYSSPLERITQNGKIYYDIRLYFLDPDSGIPRLVLFTPWAPALGLIACIFFTFALQETQKMWKWFGIVGSILMLVTSVSRGAYVFLPAVIIISWLLKNYMRPNAQIGMGLLCFVAIICATLMDSLEDIFATFRNARKSSSEVRDALNRIALDRWLESPLWGHGKQIPGPAILAEMPIGSHHTWIGLLFTQGILGVAAFLTPLACTLLFLLGKVRENETAMVALNIIFFIIFGSMSDNTEKLAYIYWSGLVVIGIACRTQSLPIAKD